MNCLSEKHDFLLKIFLNSLPSQKRICSTPEMNVTSLCSIFSDGTLIRGMHEANRRVLQI